MDLLRAYVWTMVSDRRDPREATVLFEWVWPRARRHSDLREVLTNRQMITNLNHLSLNRNEYAEEFNSADDQRKMLRSLPGIGPRLVLTIEAEIKRIAGVQS